MMGTLESDIAIAEAGPLLLTPSQLIADAGAAFWFSQVVLRLRREVAWCWYQRGGQLRGSQKGFIGQLPPYTDAASENLDLVRYAAEKTDFFNHDPSAKYLTQQMALLVRPQLNPQSSRWDAVSVALGLSDIDQFVLALALSVQVDAGLAPIFASCLNDISRPFPTLGLAQRLWHEPGAAIHCADAQHVLFRFGLLKPLTAREGSVWQKSLNMPTLVAQQLSNPLAGVPSGIMPIISGIPRPLDADSDILCARLIRSKNNTQIIPMMGMAGVPYQDWAWTLSHTLNRKLAFIEPQYCQHSDQLAEAATICWMQGFDILLPDTWCQDEQFRSRVQSIEQLAHMPLFWYLPVQDAQHKKALPSKLTAQTFNIPSMTFEQRADLLQNTLGLDDSQQSDTEECARRFRFEEQTLRRITEHFDNTGLAFSKDRLMRACANEAIFEMDNLAQLVTPRFSVDELVLPADQHQQIQDILHAMRALTVVHHYWGTAKAWNESGLAVLFCGTPGTGKTMAAEAIANTLALPMFRIDLSQVVNKYIGETEKNLKRIFDAAELSDCILFFDEADAMFGKRTDVKDAHDRFANIEVSYLLERMERFKGLAILATNRRRDLDEAFMRRLRYVVEFPVPSFEERHRIWQQVFPKGVDISDLDIRFLAKQFPLSGGHIRSIAFNACLRSANHQQPKENPVLSMKDVLIAVRRELEKANRSAADALFGVYADLLKDEKQ